MGKTTSSDSNKAYFTAYKSENRQLKNQDKKIERHLKTHPNDAQAINKSAGVYPEKPKAQPRQPIRGRH